MAGKTKRILTGIFVFLIVLLPHRESHSKVKAISLMPGTDQTAIDTNDEMSTNPVDAPDGSQWKGIFEKGVKIPKMIFGCDCSEQTGTPRAIAYNFLQQNTKLFRFKNLNDDLKFEKQITSPGTTHVIYNQTLKRLPVFNATVVVHVNSDGVIELVTNDFKEYEKAKISNTKRMIGPEDALSIVEEDLNVFLKKDYSVKQSLGLLKIGNSFTKVWRIYYPTMIPLGDWVYDIDAENGTIYRKVNAIKLLDAQGYLHSRNPNVSENKDEVILRNILEPREGEKYSLKGAFFEVLDSIYKPVFEDTPVFDYPYHFDFNIGDESIHSNPGYEQVNVYFHLENCRSYLRQLGFQIFNSYKIQADAHGTFKDQSWYSGARKMIIYGNGDVNDASDTDIVIHEFGHALVDYIKPKILHLTGEASAMHEGYADYISASYSSDPCLGEWDSIFYSDSGCLRRIDIDKVYPEDKTGRDHDDSLIWSSALWKLRSEINTDSGEDPADIANKLIVKSIYFLPDSGVTFKQGAIALLVADSNLYDKKYAGIIKKVFMERGIFDGTDNIALTD